MAILDYVVILDISVYQGHMTWATTVKKAHAVWIRSTIGAKGVDTLYAENRSGAEKVGMPYGLYHLFKPDKDPKTQAEWFASHCGHWDDGHQYEGNHYHKDIPLFPMFDIEITGGLTKQKLDDACQKFLAHFVAITGTPMIANTGVYKALIYTGAWFFDPYLPRNDWAKTYLLDVADYRNNPEPEVPLDWADRNETWTIWQRWANGDKSGHTYGAESIDIDISKFNGSISDFENLFSVKLKDIGTVDTQPFPTPPALPKAESIYDSLRIRNKPTTVASSIVGYLAKGEDVEVTHVIQSGSDVWYQIGHEQFCARLYQGTDYLLDL